MQPRPYLCITFYYLYRPNFSSSLVSPNLHTRMLSISFLRLLQPQLFQRFIFNYTSHDSKVSEVPSWIKFSILTVPSLFSDRLFSWALCSLTWHRHYNATGNESIRINVFIPLGRMLFCRTFLTIFAHVPPVGVIITDDVSWDSVNRVASFGHNPATATVHIRALNPAAYGAQWKA
jgi:hypothetical protein